MAGCIVLSPGPVYGNILQTEQSGHVLHKHSFLQVAIQQGKAARRLDNRERQSRKPRACANIEYACALEQRRHDQAVEQVRGNHLITIADRRQVDFAVPFFELVDQGAELFRGPAHKRRTEPV